MKTGISISTFASRFGPIVYACANADDLEKAFAHAAEYGYQGVDLFMDSQTPAKIKHLRHLMDTNGLEVAMAIMIYLAESGGSLTDQDNARRTDFVRRYIEEMDNAQMLGAKRMPIGLLRGRKTDDESVSGDEYEKRLAESLYILCEAAASRGITLCVEPINRYEINTLCSLDETMCFIRRYKLEDLGVLPDLFHMNIEDADIPDSLRRAGTHIRHMHVADTNRCAPGWGHMDYDAVLRALGDVGYDGYLTVEAFAHGDPDRCAAQGERFLRAKLKALQML